MNHPLQPDPALGVFSTMLVVEGRPVELDPHLAQLRESVHTLYGVELPERASELAIDEAQRIALGRVRLSCSPDGGGEPRVEAVARSVERAIVLPDAPLDLRTAYVDGWRGAHKWADRRLLEQLDAAAAPACALLVERDGTVLETTRANVFALGDDDVLRTPPLDGAILPGVTRASAIAVAREVGIAVREEPLSLTTLRAAREAFATGSVRGVEPVRSLDGVGIGGTGEVANAVADALRLRWLDRVRA